MEAAAPDASPEDRALQIRKSRLQAKIEQSNTLLQQALKLARVFERQKLSRRQKTAKDQPHELLRLKEEIICLKELDLTSTGQNYLIRRLSRAKRIRESDAFVGVYGEDVESQIKAPGNRAEANVVGRLMNSNPVKDVMPDIIAGIFEVLGLQDNMTAATTGKGADVKSKSNLPARSDSLRESLGASPEERSYRMGISTRPKSPGSQSRALSEDSESNDEITHLKSQQGSTESGSEALSYAHEGNILRTIQNLPTDEPILKHSISVSSLSSSERALSPSADSFKPATYKSDMTHPSATTFLPSLTMGGYISGSDSGDESQFRQEGHNMRSTRGPPDPLKRKNRRGQRARQQISERKYGGKANHLQNQPNLPSAKGQQDRNSGWDTRKVAVHKLSSQEKLYGTGRQGKNNSNVKFKATGANLEAVALRSSAGETKSLHPSWEAARKKKQQDIAVGTRLTNAFRGKKVTFD